MAHLKEDAESTEPLDPTTEEWRRLELLGKDSPLVPMKVSMPKSAARIGEPYYRNPRVEMSRNQVAFQRRCIDWQIVPAARNG